MDWFIERLRHANPTLDHQDLCNYADDFKRLLDLKLIKHSDNIERIPCDLCDDDHLISPFRNAKNELIASCSGSRRVVNPEELKIWAINRDALTENVSSKNPVVDKASFEETVFALKKDGEFHITKMGGDFYYKGDLRNLSKNNNWYKVFCALYTLIPDGGEITYAKLGGQIKSTIKKTKIYNTKAMIKFIQTNLTDRSNGFMHYASIPENEENGKPLLYVKRGEGIIFNNEVR